MFKYDINESALETAEFKGGSLYFCTDTGNIFLDSEASGARIQMNTGVKVVSDFPLAPIPNTIYCKLTAGTIHLFADGKWYNLGRRPQMQFDICFDKDSKSLYSGSQGICITIDELTNDDTVEFIPDSSIIDCCENLSITHIGNMVEILSSYTFPIFGVLYINKSHSFTYSTYSAS